MLDEFEIVVRTDPSRDVPAPGELRESGLSKVCPVSKATKRAIGRRFRRWRGIVAGTGYSTMSVDAELGYGLYARRVRYEAAIPGELSRARQEYDDHRKVLPVTDTVTFRRVS